MRVVSANTSSSSTRTLPGIAPKASPVATSFVENLNTNKNDKTKDAVQTPKLPGLKKRPKQIPTILALLILVVSLAAGVLLFGQGTGVFAPRATPETTPKNIVVSNVTDRSFTVSFYTDEETPGFVKYGTTAAELTEQSSDDRDQLSGVVKSYRLHHVTLRNLEPGTQYYYQLGTGTSTFDNNGQAYVLQTAAKPTVSPTSNQTIYGVVNLADGSAAEGAVVYFSNEKMGTLSALVKESGSFGVSLSTAFTPDGAAYSQISDDDILQLRVQGVQTVLTGTWQGKVSEAQPVPTLVLGSSGSQAASTPSIAVDKAALLADEGSASAQAGLSVGTDKNSSQSALTDEKTAENAATTSALTQEPSQSSATTVDLSSAQEAQPASDIVVSTTAPVIKASLPANTMVKITVHSDTVLEQTLQTDENGNVVLDIASLGENLEPGEHSATYTYIDPTTGKEVTKTYNFTVLVDASTQQLAAAATPTPTKTVQTITTPTPTPTSAVPYGSGNPYLPTPTVTVAITATPTASASTRTATVATTSGVYKSGSVGTTLLLILGALFLMGSGLSSFALLSRKND